jgi:trk system potassium uptake protein TrkH
VNVEAVFYILGRLCILLSYLLASPLLLCLVDGGLGTPTAHAFMVSAAVSMGLGIALRLSFTFEQDRFGFGEAFATVTGSWIVFTALGAMPFVITGKIPGLIDASFEVLSGFTTTGASILPDPAVLDRPLLFWRAMTHWVGGMGIVALSVAILPALGAGGNFLFQAEVPGPESEKLAPRISQTAKLLWTLYLTLTGLQFVSLWAAGMTPFDSICHTFATVATGGFGTHADSLASFGPAVQWVVILFMFLAGLNFVMLLNAMKGRVKVALDNTEVRVYTGIVVVATIACILVLRGEPGQPDGLEPLVRDASFTVVSLLTSTGFVTADYQIWPIGLHGLLLLIMFCGACAGSTGGGAKVIRCIVAIKTGVREVRRLLRPKAVFVVKVGTRPLTDQLVFKTAGFFVLYLMTLVVFSLILMAMGHSGSTSFSAVIACLSNIGPGLDGVGPTSNYAGFDGTAKLLLMFCMLLGRLEFYSVLVLLVPLAWRR